ncbi:ABC transporter substrate-binding protein [Qipengyuania sp.]|uniref:ABC transporter substrate-binding protein n=1 Tax=Qipengyuania sp. TaxID=2004515 RepID=UPI0035C7EA46
MPRIIASLLAALLALGGCTERNSDGVDVAVIGDPADFDASGSRFGLPGALLRSATQQGLVRLDETGQLIPGLAERWIVTDDGLSYIFRIRPLDVPGDDRLTARTVQKSLTRSFAQLKGTTMGLDLAKVRDVRAMTARVIEIRLYTPMPGMLQLLAQPELGITLPDIPTGPMVATRDGDSALFAVLPPQARGLPENADWAENVRPVRLTALSAEAAMEGFSQGLYEVVLGGTLADLPLVDVGPLSRGTIRLDSAMGLFGLDVRNDRGFLAEPQNREALAMALDRSALIAPFNLAGWTPTTRVVAPGLPDDPQLTTERWVNLDQEARQAEAARRVARWKAENGDDITLSVALPPGPGSDILFRELARQYGAIGIRMTRAEWQAEGQGTKPAEADLTLRDRVARYPGMHWFLNQFHCRMSSAICSADVDFLAGLSLNAATAEERAGYLAEAETALENDNVFIPIGAPIRWSLVRSGVQGFAENPWSIHPLFPLAGSPM